MTETATIAAATLLTAAGFDIPVTITMIRRLPVVTFVGIDGVAARVIRDLLHGRIESHLPRGRVVITFDVTPAARRDLIANPGMIADQLIAIILRAEREG